MIASPPPPRAPAGSTLDELVAQRERWRSEGRVVVWSNGCFDLLHVGHVRCLEAARRLGDVLVVGINDDASVREIKGPGRPLVPAVERAAVVAALGCVTRALVIGGPTPADVLERLRPDVHCKGADYAPPHGAPIPEAEIVRAYGGRVEFLPLIPERSSSKTLGRLLHEG